MREALYQSFPFSLLLGNSLCYNVLVVTCLSYILEGISYALRSGEKLAVSFGGKLPMIIRSRYEKELMSLKISIALKSLKSPIMYGKTLRGLVFKTRALRMKGNKR